MLDHSRLNCGARSTQIKALIGNLPATRKKATLTHFVTQKMNTLKKKVLLKVMKMLSAIGIYYQSTAV